MNDFIEKMVTRKSVRKYTDQPISDGDINDILLAAMSAPSARNQQPWYFYVIKNREVLDSIADKHPYGKMLKDAPVAIAVCAIVENDMQKNYWVHDCSCATQNILLASHSKGIGSVWVSIHPRVERMEMVSEILNLENNIKPLAIVSLGYSKDNKDKEKRFDKNKIRNIE